MEKEKDPAFLFYPKDWLQGTSKLMPEEKGVYIDLLSHQHQDGAIPNNTKRLARMVGLSEQDFLPIWENIKHKFHIVEFNHLVNRKLRDIIRKRSSNSRTKKITGSFASVVRLSPAPAHIKEQIKKRFNINMFYDVTDEFLNQQLINWFMSAWKSIENENGNTNANDSIEGGVGETWDTMPDDKSLKLELDKVKGGAVVELFKFTKNHDLTESELNGLWGVFKKLNVTGNRYYATKNDVYSHFINWSKTQNINNGATHKQYSAANGTRVTKSSGAEKLIGILKTEISSNTRGKQDS